MIAVHDSKLHHLFADALAIENAERVFGEKIKGGEYEGKEARGIWEKEEPQYEEGTGDRDVDKGRKGARAEQGRTWLVAKRGEILFAGRGRGPASSQTEWVD